MQLFQRISDKVDHSQRKCHNPGRWAPVLDLRTLFAASAALFVRCFSRNTDSLGNTVGAIHVCIIYSKKSNNGTRTFVAAARLIRVMSPLIIKCVGSRGKAQADLTTVRTCLLSLINGSRPNVLACFITACKHKVKLLRTHRKKKCSQYGRMHKLNLPCSNASNIQPLDNHRRSPRQLAGVLQNLSSQDEG